VLRNLVERDGSRRSPTSAPTRSAVYPENSQEGLVSLCGLRGRYGVTSLGSGAPTPTGRYPRTSCRRRRRWAPQTPRRSAPPRRPRVLEVPLTGASDFHVPLLWGLRELGQHRAYPSAPACVLVRSRRWRLWSSSAVLHHTYSRPSPGAAIRRRGRAASFPIPPPPLRRSKR
jgi:hypothetical protein